MDPDRSASGKGADELMVTLTLSEEGFDLWEEMLARPARCLGSLAALVDRPSPFVGDPDDRSALCEGS